MKNIIGVSCLYLRTQKLSRHSRRPTTNHNLQRLAYGLGLDAGVV